MRSGGTAPTYHDRKENVIGDTIADRFETRIGEEVEQLDGDTFELFLKNIHANRINYLPEEPSTSSATAAGEGESTENHISIMGLVDEAKKRLNAEITEQHNRNTANAKTSEEVIEKPPPPAVRVITKPPHNMTLPICGNPVTDYDKINEMNGLDGENHMFKPEQLLDPFSRMEMGQMAQAVDDLDLEKVEKSQKNYKCNEQEQLDWLMERRLIEFKKYNVLGPASKGEFSAFMESLSTPVISCDVGVTNPLSAPNYSTFQCLTPNGRLLPAVPRKYPSQSEPPPRSRPAPQKPPITIMLQSNSRLTANNTITPPSSASTSPPPPDPENQKKKKKLKKADESEDHEEAEEEEDKENEISVEEREARRAKNRKIREKKARKKAAQEARQAAEEARQAEHLQREERILANSVVRMALQEGLPPPQEESPKNRPNGRRSIGTQGGKHKKNEKGVSQEYTVKENGEDSQNLSKILKDLGINDISELSENPGKKNKKGVAGAAGSGKKNSKQQQVKREQPQKEVARAPPADNEPIVAEEEEEKSDKKMDEVAVAASITSRKRSSSGAAQQSEEDDDQSYVSAQENLGGSNSRLSTPPTEFADARQSRDEAIENVMADPNNYRDDDDVETLAKQLQQEEDEFITVGKNRKKNKKQSSVQDNGSSSSSASSSASPSNRRNTLPDARASSAIGYASSSSTATPATPQSQQQQHFQRNRPAAHSTTLADFIDSTKKETHKNVKHKKISAGAGAHHKKHESMEEPVFLDAPETISVNTAPGFSYADAAKKTSGENSPEMSPIPPPPPASTASAEPIVEKKPLREGSSGGAVQLPPSTLAASDISFGYEETPEDKRKRLQKESKSVTSPPPPTQKAPPPPPTRMNGDDLLRSFTTQDGNGGNRLAGLQEMPKTWSSESNVLGTEILANWKPQWEKFMNTGAKPITFVPKKK
ncbi:Suppressor of PAr-Two defect [Caenorhabditis elegans]|uniref:Suppressor of PAr-Two defect n=2 Tax=Caenorhabditis elegans TaxID=6239 RepID=A0A8S4QCI7_CAEEL|nr:Suppressor of PAr-Two defect [Caenorhabditis elegans]CAH2176280.1 Suppressor of PAr-Two defect [Caenorhabditis elegans]